MRCKLHNGQTTGSFGDCINITLELELYCALLRQSVTHTGISRILLVQKTDHVSPWVPRGAIIEMPTFSLSTFPVWRLLGKGQARFGAVDSVHCTALHCTALNCTALHCTALHCTALPCTALHCTALHCNALQCTALHCILI